VKKLAVFFLGGVLAYGSGPRHEKVSKDLKNVDPSSTVDVIVQWNSGANQEQDDKVSNWGGRTKHKFSSVKAGKYSLPAYAVSTLANDPDVAFISPDRPVSAKLDYSAAAINASAAWSRHLNGNGITVAVIDSGMNESPELGTKGSVVYSEDFTGEFQQAKDVRDTHNAPDLFGHGQHVAGIIGSNGHGSSCASCTRTMTGIAPGVKFVNLRALDENGAGTDSSVIAAIDRARVLRHGERGTATTTPGSGLGLYSAVQRMEAQDGTLDVHQRPGGGTRITLTLPTLPAIDPPRPTERTVRWDGTTSGGAA